MITRMDLIRWGEKERKDARAWHESKGIDSEKLDIFDAGFRDGWKKAVSVLLLHKAISFGKD